MLLATLLQFVGFVALPLTVKYLAQDELIGKYLDAVESQASARQDVAVEVTIDARLNRQATLRTLRSTSATGTITYATLDARGDSMVRREVIARYLAAESKGRKMDEIAITPFNYRFRLKGIIEQQTRQVYVFQLVPKKKKVGLFKRGAMGGRKHGAARPESGQSVKNPSVFVRRIVFVRDYETRYCGSVPTHIRSTVDTRLAGRVELDIHFSNLRRRDSDRCGESEP
jgi:hypothetical protein